MKKQRVAIAVIVGILLIASAAAWLWWTHRPAETPLSSTANPPAICGVPASDNIAPDATVHIPDNERVITQIAVGQTVRWVNDSNETVTIRSLAVGGDKECGGINQPSIQPGGTWQLTFLRPGTWHFAVGGVGIGVIEAK